MAMDEADEKRLRCMIVDDNAGFLAAAKALLERQGLEVVGVASTSREATSLAGRLQPDVALVDVVLGEESGFDLARRLAQDDRARRTKVILISTYAEVDCGDLVEKSLAAAFLSKADLSGAAVRSVYDRATA